MDQFPFPDQRTSREELLHDRLIHKVPKEHHAKIADQAWECGERAARELFGEKQQSVYEAAELAGLKLTHIDKDNVIGGQRYFSEYYSGRHEVLLYVPSIRLWAESNQMTYEEAEELILAHEYYHYLECSTIGFTYRMYEVPVIVLGRWVLAKSGLRSLSEIGAHAFARMYFTLQKDTVHFKKTPDMV